MRFLKASTFSDDINRQQGIPNTVSRKKALSACVAAAFMVGASMVTVEDAAAADVKKKLKNKAPNAKVVNDLQTENAYLREQLQKLQAAQSGRGLPQQDTTGASAPALGAIPAEESAEVVAQKQAAETDNLGEVVVSGRSRPKLAKLKEVTVSASVVGGDELKSTQSTDMSSILQRVGNIKWNPGNSRTAGLTLRGLGMVPLTDQMDSSVGYVVDGVPYSYGPMNSFDQFDVDQVEVDRGPQGTAGGKNYNMGQVNITNKQAAFANEASGSVSYGRYNTVIGDAALGGTVVDGLLAFRGALHVNKGDGSTHNLYNPGQTWYNRDREAVRLSFLLTPTENFTAKFNFDAQPSSSEMYNGNSFYTQTPSHYSNGMVNPLSTDASTRLARPWFTNQLPSYSYAGTYLNGAGKNSFDMNSQFPLVSNAKGGSAVLDWQLDNYKLTSTTAVRDYNFQAYNDEGTPFSISQNGGGSIHEFSQLSEELKLASSIGKLVDYQTGLYLLERKMNLGSATGFGSDAGAWFASTKQYNTLSTTGNGQRLMSDSLNNVATSNPNLIDNKTAALFGEAKWHITEPLTLTTGVRVSNENRENQTSKFIVDQGAGVDLNPVAVNGVQTGGFSSYSADVLAVDGVTVLHHAGELKAGNNAQQQAIANAIAQQYFGTAASPVTYAGLTTAQLAQVAAAKSIRASNIGSLWAQVPGQTFRATQPSFSLSPSYKINEAVTAYTSWRYAEKAGFSQTVNGSSSQIMPEINNAFEIGFKSTLLNNDLIFNGDVFLSQIHNYQQGVSILDKYTTAQKADGNNYYTAASGNVPGVRAFGVELDGVYRGIDYTSIRFAGSYNNATYTDFKTSAVPLELAYTAATGAPPAPAYRDVTGMTLPGAAKFTFNVGPEVRFPLKALGLAIPGNQEFHANFNTSFTSAYNSDPLLSSYGWIKANSTTDLSIGIGRQDKGFDLSFVAKNVFNNTTPGARLWNSYTLGQPQWFGVTVSAKM